MIPIVQYLKEGKLPDDKQEVVKVVALLCRAEEDTKGRDFS